MEQKSLPARFCRNACGELDELRSDVLECRKCGKRELRSRYIADSPSTTIWELHGKTAVLPGEPPVSLASTADGELWVACQGGDLVALERNRKTNRFEPRNGSRKELGEVRHLAADLRGPSLYAADPVRGVVHRLRSASRWQVDVIEGLGTILGLAVDSVGGIYTLERTPPGASIIARSDAGERKWELIPCQLDTPVGLALSSLRRGEELVLTDGGEPALVSVSRRGRLWWRQPLGAATEMRYPRALAVAPQSGQIVVASDSSCEIFVFDEIGNPIQHIETESITPACIAFSANEKEMYVGDDDEPCLWRFCRSLDQEKEDG